MTGISPISALSFIQSNFATSDTLTAATRAKLVMVGIDTTNIKTESEGRAILMRAMAQESSQTSYTTSSSNQQDEATRLAKSLASDLDVIITDNDSLDDIIVKLRTKIAELQSEAKDDKNKLSSIKDYSDRLALIEQAQLSQINLGTTMDLISDSNRSYFGL